MLPRQHACTSQQVKNSLIDWENVKFWASQAVRLRMLPRQHAQKNHIIGGPACTYPINDFLVVHIDGSQKKLGSHTPMHMFGLSSRID